MNLILLGAPGAGKGTQAELLMQHLGIPSISTGNMLREAMANGSELGKQVKQYMDGGNLVPDEVVLGIVAQRVAQPDCKNGFILDGFPRTVPQAEALDELGVKIDYVVDIDVDDADIVERMGGRRVCEACGMSYHIKYIPTKDNKTCDKCGANLIIRKDDQPETVLERLKIYHDQTEPLKDYYGKKGILKSVDGRGDITEITELILKSIRA